MYYPSDDQKPFEIYKHSSDYLVKPAELFKDYKYVYPSYHVKDTMAEDEVEGEGIFDIIKNIGSKFLEHGLPALGKTAINVASDTASKVIPKIIENKLAANTAAKAVTQLSQSDILEMLSKATDAKERIELIKLLNKF